MNTINWNPRIKRYKLRLLYRFAGMGIYDERYILDVGWGLYLRCQDILTVINAVKKGKVLCPQCQDSIIYRSKHRFYLAKLKSRKKEEKLVCSNCQHSYSWKILKEELRQIPRCLKCGQSLEWDYNDNSVHCPGCKQTWGWQQYRKSLRNRKWLPCPHCGLKTKKPEHKGIDNTIATEYICPVCKGEAYHLNGNFVCYNCGYKKSWRTYQLNEAFTCNHCGHKFNWRSWRKNYTRKNLLVGNETIFQSYYSAFPKAKSLKASVLEIDRLIHAVHARGSLGEALIEGDKTTVREMLNELAYN